MERHDFRIEEKSNGDTGQNWIRKVNVSEFEKLVQIYFHRSRKIIEI